MGNKMESDGLQIQIILKRKENGKMGNVKNGLCFIFLIL